jgi:hypothetical protein
MAQDRETLAFPGVSRRADRFVEAEQEAIPVTAGRTGLKGLSQGQRGNRGEQLSAGTIDEQRTHVAGSMLSWIYSLPIKKIQEQEEFIRNAKLLATDGLNLDRRRIIP